jgi:hypothetical protein
MRPARDAFISTLRLHFSGRVHLQNCRHVRVEISASLRDALLHLPGRMICSGADSILLCDAAFMPCFFCREISAFAPCFFSSTKTIFIPRQ